ncbi:hypothetical protein H4S01_003346 [Coemansia sp. RSA 2610]|nr:hypothetical protein H4S01_003346 [Coemansia sp. RSA 2610]
MDEFISTVKNQEIPLHPLDTQAAFMNVPYHFFYANDAGTAASYMPSETMRMAFYQALQKFPLLAGHLRSDGTGKTTVVVDRAQLNMPEYLESTSDVDFATLREAKFHHSAWPRGLSTTKAITTAGASGHIKLLNVHVVRLHANSGVVVFVNVPHYVVDGAGFFTFVELWGTLCRATRTNDPALRQEAVARPLCFDRGLIGRSLPDKRTPLDTETVRVYTESSLIADWLAWLSPVMRGRVLSRAKFSSNVVSHTFRVSRDALAELRARVCAHLDELDVNVDDTHVLAALVSKMVAQAHAKCREQHEQSRSMFAALASWLVGLVSGSETKSSQSLNLLADVRHGLDIVEHNYMGNGLIPHNAQCPLELLETPTTAKSLADATSIVSRVYAGADAPRVASFIDMISAEPSCFTRPMVYFARNPTSLVITNETGFKLYAADFGDGLPEWVCTIPSFVANFIGFLPSPPSSTDIIVNITLKQPVMQHVLKNEFWRDLATIVY